jgi:hypothetical protein
MSEINYALTLGMAYPGREWSLSGNDYATLVMHDDGPKPSKKALEDKWSQVEYDRQVAEIKAERRARYAAETDGLYFEAMRGDGNLDAWKAATAQVRADLPYPEAP